MFRHVKKLQYTVRVSEPNPGLANLLLEQFGGHRVSLQQHADTSLKA